MFIAFISFQLPFFGADETRIKQRTVSEDPDIPFFLSSTATNLIQQVCTVHFACYGCLLQL